MQGRLRVHAATRVAERERIMIRTVRTAAATVLAAASIAAAAPILHFDVNGITVQASNSLGVSSAFGGLSHTGSLNFGFSAGISTLEAIEVQQAPGGASVNQGFTGALSNFTGTINLVNGRVTGGTLRIDSAPGSGTTVSGTLPVAELAHTGGQR